MLSRETNTNIKVLKGFADRKAKETWHASAEEKQLLSSIDMFRVVNRSGMPLYGNSEFSENYPINTMAGLREMEEELSVLTEQKGAVSTGYDKDKGGKPAVSDAETVSKGDLF